MDPERIKDDDISFGVPRTRGDGPETVREFAEQISVSPHTRGWTLAAPDDDGADRGFPAHAGMDPQLRCSYSVLVGFPRTRGDAGMDPRRSQTAQDPYGFSRTRGDGPCTTTSLALVIAVSPHTRGWTLSRSVLCPIMRGFPAHAGMDP